MSKFNAFDRFTAKLLLTASPVALAVTPTPAAAQVASGPGATLNAGTINGQFTASGTGGAVFTGATANTGGADTSTITLGSSRTILNWNDLNLSSGDTLNFVFGSSTDLVLNRVVGANFTSIDGAVFGKVGSTAGASGGNIWILNPNGILVGSTGSINAGGILLSTLGMADADFFNDLSFNLSGTGTPFISVAPSANLTAANGAVTLVGPSIGFAGNITASGSAALIGASDAQIIFDSDLDAYLGITINQGSTENVAVDVGQSASFNTAPVASGGKTYLIAAGNGAGLGSIVLGGIAADRVDFVEGDVVLYAAGNVTAPKSIVSGGVLQAPGSATGGGDVTIGAANVSAGNLNAIAVDDVAVNHAASVSGNARLEAGGDLTVATAVTAGGDYTIRADDFYGAAAFNPNEGGDINIEDTAGGLTIGGVTATDDLRITAENGQLTIAGSAITANGGGIFLTTTGANAGAGHDLVLQSNVTDTGSDDAIALSSSGSIVQSGGVVSTASLSASAVNGIDLDRANLIGALTNLQNSGAGDVHARSNVVGGVLIGDVDAANGDITLASSTGVRLVGGTSDVDAPSGDIVINGPSTISGAVAINVAGTGEGTVTFANAVNGAALNTGNLTVTATGGTTFAGAVGGTATLNTLSVNGRANINGGSVNTGGAQAYNGAVVLGANAVLSSTGAGVINFGGTVDGAQALIVNTSGVTTFGGDVGAMTALASLTTNAGGTTLISGGSIRTTGAQNYGDNVILSNGLHTLNGASAAFGGTVGAVTFGSPTLSVTTTGATSFANTIFGLGALGVSASNVSFAGANNSVGTLAANITAGGFSFGTDSSLTIGTVNGLSGITTAAGQHIRIETPTSISARTLTVAAPITASGGGDVTIIYWGGSLQGSGLISGDHLLMATNEGVGTSTVPIRTAVNSMSVWGGNQGAFIDETDAVTLLDSTIPACSGTCTSTINNGGASYDLTAGGTITVGGFTWAGGDISLTANSGDISFTPAGQINASGDLRLTAAGNLNGGGGPLSAQNIFLTADDWTNGILGAATLQESNNLSITDTAGGLTISSLTGVSAANGLSIETTAGSLSVGGVSAAGDISLSSAGDLALSAALDASGNTLALNAAGNITQAAAFSAGTLTGSAGGFAELTFGANQIGTLGPFTAERLRVSDSGGLTVTGPVSGGSQEVSIATSGDLLVNAGISSATSVVLSASGAGADIVLNGAVSGNNEVGLSVGGSIGQSAAGAITANNFYASATDGVALTAAANDVTNLLSSGGNGFALVDSGGLALTGTVNGGAVGVGISTTGDLRVDAAVASTSGPISLAANGAGSDLGIYAAVNAGTGTVDLVAGATIGQSAGGIVTGGTLTGSAGGTILLGASNQIAALGNLSGSSIVVADTGGLAIAGAVNAGAGDATIRTSGGDLTMESTGSVAGAEVVLSTDQGFINQSGADAIAASERWLIYSAAPDTSSFGGLDSGNTAIWYATLATRSPATISGGNRYAFAFQPTLTFASANTNKTYGTLLTTSGYTVTGFHAGVAGAFLGDTAASAFGGAPVLSSPGYAADATVVGGPYTIGIAAGTVGSSSGYALAFDGSGSLTVDPKALTGTVTANDKTYDGTADATGSIALAGVLSGDEVTASALLAFADANAGSDKTVLISGGSLSGADAGNYTLSLPASVLADIFKKAITGSVVADDKTYDGTADATGSITLDGVVTGDEVTAAAILAFADANAGSDKVVTVTGGSLSGADAGNYTLSLPASVLADIFKNAITGTVVADDKTYDGTTAASGSFTLDGLIAGDEVTASAILTFADANAGNDKVVSVTGGSLSGADAGNYTLNLPASVLADIFQKTLTGTVVANDKTYDGTTDATGSITLDGVIGGDEVLASAILAFADANAGSDKTVTISGGALSGSDSANYTLTLPASVVADIFKKALTGTVVASDKTYDGTTGATGSVSLSGLIAGDEVTASALLAFADKNAGSDKTVLVSGGSLAGADAGNYTLSLPASVLADIFKLAISGTVVVNDKTYDGTTSATGEFTLSGVLASDSVTAAAILAFADANAGNDKSVTISGAGLAGADAGNYTVTLPASTLADIFRAALTVTADSLSKGQGTSDPALTYAITSGQLFGSDALTGAIARALGELPGTYVIGQGTLAASPNYELTFAPGALTIEASTPTVEPQIGLTEDVAGLLERGESLGSAPDGRLLIVDERDCEPEPGAQNLCSGEGRN